MGIVGLLENFHLPKGSSTPPTSIHAYQGPCRNWLLKVARLWGDSGGEGPIFEVGSISRFFSTSAF
jgi:hypothetical protein